MMTENNKIIKTANGMVHSHHNNIELLYSLLSIIIYILLRFLIKKEGDNEILHDRFSNNTKSYFT